MMKWSRQIWIRLCLSSCSWYTASLNIVLCAHATVKLSLFSIRSVVSGTSSCRHQDRWNHSPSRLFVSYISASEGLHSKEWLLALHREKWFASTSSKLAFSKVSGPHPALHSTFLGPFWATCNISMAWRYKKNLFVCLFQVVLHGKSCRLCHSL